MPSLRQAAYGQSVLPLELVEDLIAAAVTAARETRQAATRAKPRPRRPSLTLRPGPDTPLWNELVEQAQPYLRKRGSKADLARLLHLPRQRVHDCLKAKSACLDAERALLLMCWVAAKQQKRPFLL